MFWKRKVPPIKNKDVVSCLTRLGFEEQPQKSTAHRQFKRVIDGRMYKVTVDSHLAPFSNDLIKAMAKQAGFKNWRQFVAYCLDKNYKRAAHPLEEKPA